MGAIVITGSGGQLGSELCRQLGPGATGLARASLDVTDPHATGSKLSDLQPAAVINCAAFTGVDQAEDSPRECHAANVAGVKNLAQECRKLGALLVHISTDYVFGNPAPPTRPWREDDEPAPRGVYAASKQAGEKAAAALGRHLIVRTCGLYASGQEPEARNFVNTVLRFSRAGRVLSVVDDQHCTPSYVPHVAAAIVHLTQAALAEEIAYGTYHVTNGGQTTWHQFAQEVLRLANIDTPVRRISTKEYAAAAPRPAMSVLDTTKYQATGGPNLPDWREALKERFTGLHV